MSSTAVTRIALGAVALHVVAAELVLPPAGTSATGHIASALVPLAFLVAVAAVVHRLRHGARAAVAMTVGTIAIAFGIPSVYAAAEGAFAARHATGFLALAGGAVLLATGPVTLWRSRRRDGSSRRRWARRAAISAAGAVAGFVVLLWVVAPIGFAYGYTHIGRVGPAPALAVDHERVAITTSDGVELSARYLPSRNRAAIVVFPGRSATKEALMLARNGYGVLLLDPRGQGESEGDLVRWAGDRDLIAGAEYLQRRPDVDPERIGGFGSSVGGEILIEAAARSTAFKAVVSEGAGLRIGDGTGLVHGAERVLMSPALTVLTAATTVFSNHRPPPPIVDRIGLIAPRPLLLVYADPGMGGEAERQGAYFAAAGRPKELWKVPGAEHTGGIEAAPEEYERRVAGFFDRALLGD